MNPFQSPWFRRSLAVVLVTGIAYLLHVDQSYGGSDSCLGVLDRYSISLFGSVSLSTGQSLEAVMSFRGDRCRNCTGVDSDFTITAWDTASATGLASTQNTDGLNNLKLVRKRNQFPDTGTGPLEAYVTADLSEGGCPEQEPDVPRYLVSVSVFDNATGQTVSMESNEAWAGDIQKNRLEASSCPIGVNTDSALIVTMTNRHDRSVRVGLGFVDLDGLPLKRLGEGNAVVVLRPRSSVQLRLDGLEDLKLKFNERQTVLARMQSDANFPLPLTSVRLINKMTGQVIFMATNEDMVVRQQLRLYQLGAQSLNPRRNP